MMSIRPAAPPATDSTFDTILTLPEDVGSIALANACRESALAFLNEAERWGKAELAMWLMGPYAQLTRHVAGVARGSGEYVRHAPMLREIDARMVERVVRSAREEVLEVLARAGDADGGAAFAFAMLAAGFVARCEDKTQRPGWVPTADARRLADRVLSLFAADYLTRPGDYETELSICGHCKTVEFDGVSRMRGICPRHGSGLFVHKRSSTIPYLPEGA